ncbi:hypothetical protein GGX14DRAFT_398370 [Mycena pura]|uniref:Uncharacterized protein n=1 Tax=Mycena pura TaxID=153505 RepID=A0AAD6Y9M0_9AGAR|nr:hypothetical protein GGX14DRAFT_398370 [Mycena pura]
MTPARALTPPLISTSTQNIGTNVHKNLAKRVAIPYSVYREGFWEHETHQPSAKPINAHAAPPSSTKRQRIYNRSSLGLWDLPPAERVIYYTATNYGNGKSKPGSPGLRGRRAIPQARSRLDLIKPGSARPAGLGGVLWAAVSLNPATWSPQPRNVRNPDIVHRWNRGRGIEQKICTPHEFKRANVLWVDDSSTLQWIVDKAAVADAAGNPTGLTFRDYTSSPLLHLIRPLIATGPHLKRNLPVYIREARVERKYKILVVKSRFAKERIISVSSHPSSDGPLLPLDSPFVQRKHSELQQLLECCATSDIKLRHKLPECNVGTVDIGGYSQRHESIACAEGRELRLQARKKAWGGAGTEERWGSYPFGYGIVTSELVEDNGRGASRDCWCRIQAELDFSEVKTAEILGAVFEDEIQHFCGKEIPPDAEVLERRVRTTTNNCAKIGSSLKHVKNTSYERDFVTVGAAVEVYTAENQTLAGAPPRARDDGCSSKVAFTGDPPQDLLNDVLEGECRQRVFWGGIRVISGE